MQKKFVKSISTLMAFVLLLSATSTVAFAKESPYVSTHKKINITDVTGEIVEAPLLTSAASSVAKEKAWYEYVYYSDKPVAHYYVDETTRLSFFDPYDYADALVMEVDDSITDWSSNNSMQVSYTTGNSLTDTTGKSSETVSTVNYGYSDITTTTTGPSTVTTTVENQTDEYNTSKTVTTDNSNVWSTSASLTINEKIKIGVDSTGSETDFGTTGTDTRSWTEGDVETKVVSTDGTGRSGYTKSKDTTTVNSSQQVVTVANTIADRTAKATGYSTNSAVSLSTNNSTTITKTYDAGYFNDRGAPLQWKIIKYTVKMPMFFQIEHLVDGEWIYGDSNYCTINTIQGTCRAWLENNVAYYEHWGTGEPVTWDEFWGQFFTEESLIAAYKNKLYPDN